MNRIIIKSITLICFAGLIIAFVSYRSGFLDNPLQSSPNGGSINSTQNTSGANEDSIPVMMPSSKVLIIKEQPFILEDSIAQKKKIDDVRKKEAMMYGSKSAIIFERNDLTDSAEISTEEWIESDTLKLNR